jgi:DNA gyrase subunit A
MRGEFLGPGDSLPQWAGGMSVARTLGAITGGYQSRLTRPPESGYSSPKTNTQPLGITRAAGNSVAGFKLAGDGDEVIATVPLTCENGEAILSISEKGWKVTELADIPMKGRGGAGVGFTRSSR